MAEGPYQIEGEHHILAWSWNEPPEALEAVLDWLPKLAANPVAVSTAHLDRRGVPGFVAHIPHTGAYIDYTVIEQYKVVMILDVRSTRLDDLKDDLS
ncbi:MAG: hypothetical protein ACR2KK_10110 [Acidimicrobiales bacterium]